MEAIIDQAKRLRDTGSIAEALTACSRAVELARQLNDPAGEAKSLIVLSSVQTSDFHYRAALESLQKAAVLANRLQDKRLEGAAMGNIATIYSQLGDLEKAESEAQQAIESLKQDPNPDERGRILRARALLSLAALRFQSQRNHEGYADAAEALALVPDDSPTQQRTRALIWDVEGTALMLEGRLSEAANCFQTASRLLKKLSDIDALAIVNEHLAELESDKDHPDTKRALYLIDEAFKAPSPMFKRGPQYYPIHIRGKILLESGDKEAALSEFMRAVTAANEWRLGALPGDTTSTRTVAALQRVYEDYAQLAADLALQNKDNRLAINALQVLAQNRAANLREQLRRVYTSNFKLPDEYYAELAQLQSAQAAVTLGRDSKEEQARLKRIRLRISDLENQIGIKPGKIGGWEERNSRRNSLRDIQHTLSRDQVLLSITLGKGRSYMWAVTGEKVRLMPLAGEGELTSKAELFRTAVQNNRDSSPSAVDLTRALFAGLPNDVWDRSEWMIVADGPLLNGIPFCALSDSRSAASLFIRSRSLRFLPSELMLLDHAASRERADFKRNFIGVGDPIYNQADARLVATKFPDAKTVTGSITLARLVGSEKEIKAAAKESGSPDAILLNGAKATRENLAAALEHGPGIVHFAVHVVSPPDQPQQAALALSINKNGIPELLTPEVVASLHAPGSLVVLSGCSSAQGRFIPGAGLVGLSRAWLLAGAAAVVVSSWPTPDDSGRFFASFYNHFNLIESGETAQRAALALRQTQLDMLHGTSYQTSPAFWGAFAVISKE